MPDGPLPGQENVRVVTKVIRPKGPENVLFTISKGRKSYSILAYTKTTSMLPWYHADDKWVITEYVHKKRVETIEHALEWLAKLYNTNATPEKLKASGEWKPVRIVRRLT